MRIISALFILCLIVSCSSSKEITSTSGELDGSWLPVKQEIRGQELPLESFLNQRLTIIDTSFLFIAEGADEGTIKYDGSKMDIHVESGVNAGKFFPAIFKLENSLLTICYNLAGNSYPKEFETLSNPNFFLVVFKRE